MRSKWRPAALEGACFVRMEGGREEGKAALCGRVREGNERQQMSVGVSRSGHGADLRRDFSLDGFPTL